MAVYLDYNATTPVDPEVADLVLHYLTKEFGNSGSRTHAYGVAASRAVEKARKQVASVVACEPDEVTFTSGATESNNIAILGLARSKFCENRKHILSSGLEHKAVLEPLEQLSREGFEVELIPTDSRGWVDPELLAERLRPETALVSLMHVNNETGVIQPVESYARVLDHHEAALHVDAAQGFAKDYAPLRNPRIDLISISGHKIHAPKGVGALVSRRRGFDKLPLQPLMYGGGQELGLRPGTMPVALVAGLGLAAELAAQRHKEWQAGCQETFSSMMRLIEELGGAVHGDSSRMLMNAVNFSVPGLDSEAAMLALKGLVAVSNGSACTSHSYKPSHVLSAMGVEGIGSALRVSWCGRVPEQVLEDVRGRLQQYCAPAP